MVHPSSKGRSARGQGSGVGGQATSPRPTESVPLVPVYGGKLHRLFTEAAIFLVMLLLAMAVGCNRQKEGEEAVAWVNGEPIRFSLFWDEIKNRYNEVAEASSPQQDLLLVLKKKVLNDLIRERLLLQEAARRGIKVNEDALDARIEQIRDGYTGSRLRKSLLEHSMDYEQWRKALRENMTMEALFAAVVQDAGTVEDQEVSRYYSDHLDEFLIPESVELNQIVVKSRSTAKRLLRRIRQGASFETLAAKHSIGPEREDGGRLGTFQRGELPVQLEEAAFSTPTGRVTALLETEHGFHLLKVVRRIPPHVRSLEEAGEEIRERLARERRQAFYDDWVERLVQSSDIRVHASLVQLVVKEESTRPLPFKSEVKREEEE